MIVEKILLHINNKFSIMKMKIIIWHSPNPPACPQLRFDRLYAELTSSEQGKICKQFSDD